TQAWTVNVSTAPNTETDVLSFTFPGITTDIIHDFNNHTISIEVEQGTDISNLAPVITVSTGAIIEPGSGVAQDFSSPITYTITAEDSTTQQDWVVNVSVVLGIHKGHLHGGSEEVTLGNNYPNPFNGKTVIPFYLPQGHTKYQVTLTIYDLTGKKMTDVLEGELTPGEYETSWDSNSGTDGLLPGLYYYRLLVQTPERQWKLQRRMMVE
ncbi:MAG: T9SS type A sorting domain-containing protein, partial [Cyclobacteriaceae bacterium]|nr:T9SS type A sorting domain-containing protein [Cyclobacteriaceae bacterium]